MRTSLLSNLKKVSSLLVHSLLALPLTLRSLLFQNFERETQAQSGTQAPSQSQAPPS